MSPHLKHQQTLLIVPLSKDPLNVRTSSEVKSHELGGPDRRCPRETGETENSQVQNGDIAPQSQKVTKTWQIEKANSQEHSTKRSPNSQTHISKENTPENTRISSSSANIKTKPERNPESHAQPQTEPHREPVIAPIQSNCKPHEGHQGALRGNPVPSLPAPVPRLPRAHYQAPSNRAANRKREVLRKVPHLPGRDPELRVSLHEDHEAEGSERSP